MSTLLDRSSLPVWVFIIIIVVGSICILITAALIIRCHVIKRRAQKDTSFLETEQGPVRRMTVKRGRMVPASNYLSLTGSKFGLNQFDEAETVKSGRKSPFEWWNSIKDRRGDDMSQHNRSGSISDIFTRREFAQSTNSLASIKEANNTVQELEPSLESPTALPSPTSTASSPSFSRPFNQQPRVSSTPFMNHARNLSMIEEASPHNSMISVRSNPRKSGMSLNPSHDNLTRYEPRRPSQNSLGSSIPSSPHTASSFNHSRSDPDILRPLAYVNAYNGSRSSLGEIEHPQPTLSKRSSVSRHDSVLEDSRHRGSGTPLISHDRPTPHEGYWSSRRDLQPVSNSVYAPAPAPAYAPTPRQSHIPVPVSTNSGMARSNSKKGNVLRKKSLKRQEVLSMVG
jgi:hypothetical protein